MSIVISHNSPLHNSLPTLSLGFILFFPHLIAGYKKAPFPQCSPRFLIPHGLVSLYSSFIITFTSELVPLYLFEYNSKYQPLGQPKIRSSFPNLQHGCRSVFPPWGVYHPGSTAER